MTIGLASCLVLALILIVIGTGIFALANRKKGPPHAPTEALPRRSGKGWRSWIGYVGVALVLSLWSIFAGLLFLIVVWIVRENPNPDSTFHVGEEEKKIARRVYAWLFFSPLLTVPFFLILLISSYSGNPTNNRLVLVALAPLLFHLPLLLGFTSKSVFVFRHTQQGILLIALRAGLAATALTITEQLGDSALIFLFANGSLWLFSSIWGWIEVGRGTCWLMKQKRDAIRPAVEEAVPPEIKMLGTLTPEKYMEYSKWYWKHQRRDTAKEYALEAFRHGNFETRRQAIQLLDDMNEVGFF